MHKPVTTLKTDRKAWTPRELLEAWHQYLQEKDRITRMFVHHLQPLPATEAWLFGPHSILLHS